MITIKTGNLLDAEERVIVHQVNHQGVMGAGLAKQIKRVYPKCFELYKNICENNAWKEIQDFGGVIYYTSSNGKTIVNLFGQRYYGSLHFKADYEAMRNGFQTIAKRSIGSTIAIPYGIGCGLGKGNWDIVYDMICEVFKDNDVVIYKLEE